MFVFRDGNDFMCSKLFYSYKQLSFFCNPRFMQVYSLLINDLDLAFNDNLELVGISGLCAHQGWIEKDLSTPRSVQGVLRYTGRTLNAGMSYRIADFPAYFDAEKRWIFVGDISPAESVMQVLDGVLIALNQGSIHGVWLKPTFHA